MQLNDTIFFSSVQIDYLSPWIRITPVPRPCVIFQKRQNTRTSSLPVKIISIWPQFLLLFVVSKNRITLGPICRLSMIQPLGGTHSPTGSENEQKHNGKQGSLNCRQFCSPNGDSRTYNLTAAKAYLFISICRLGLYLGQCVQQNYNQDSLSIACQHVPCVRNIHYQSILKQKKII